MAESRSLPDPPTDGITQISYLGSTSLLASSSWDGTLKIHDTEESVLQVSQAMNIGPLLSLATTEDAVFVGGLDGSIKMFQVGSKADEAVSLIGRHVGSDRNAVSCLCALQPPDEAFDPETGEQLEVSSALTVVSAGWNGKLCVWDVASKKCLATLDLPGKAFCMDRHENRVIVCCAGGRTVVIDWMSHKNEAKVVLERESSLKYQARCVKFSPDGNSIAIGSVEGRVALEYLEELGLPAAGKKYAFKCHRANDLVYPVNAISFHPMGTFATGGCDGTVVTWDGLNKKKLATFPTFPTSIASLCFRKDGKELAIASSYTFEEGEREHPKDEIFIRPLTESDYEPKKQ